MSSRNINEGMKFKKTEDGDIEIFMPKEAAYLIYNALKSIPTNSKFWTTICLQRILGHLLEEK